MTEAILKQTAVSAENGTPADGNGGNSTRSAKSDTGHAKNVANFGMLISALGTYGASYNPSPEDLKIESLRAVHAAAADSMNNVKKSLNEYRECVNRRQAGFKNMSKLTTKIKKAAHACNCDKMDMEEISSICKKIAGSPVSRETDTEGGRSVSQRSYDLRLDNFKFLLDKLTRMPAYLPNEAGLNITALAAHADTLGSATAGIQDSINMLNKSRTDRNHLLYDEPDGLVPLTQRVKQYIGSIYDIASNEYKRISRIKFSNFKNR